MSDNVIHIDINGMGHGEDNDKQGGENNLDYEGKDPFWKSGIAAGTKVARIISDAGQYFTTPEVVDACRTPSGEIDMRKLHEVLHVAPSRFHDSYRNLVEFFTVEKAINREDAQRSLVTNNGIFNFTGSSLPDGKRATQYAISSEGQENLIESGEPEIGVSNEYSQQAADWVEAERNKPANDIEPLRDAGPTVSDAAQSNGFSWNPDVEPEPVADFSFYHEERRRKEEAEKKEREQLDREWQAKQDDEPYVNPMGPGPSGEGSIFDQPEPTGDMFTNPPAGSIAAKAAKEPNMLDPFAGTSTPSGPGVMGPVGGLGPEKPASLFDPPASAGPGVMGAGPMGEGLGGGSEKPAGLFDPPTGGGPGVMGAGPMGEGLGGGSEKPAGLFDPPTGGGPGVMGAGPMGEGLGGQPDSSYGLPTSEPTDAVFNAVNEPATPLDTGTTQFGAVAGIGTPEPEVFPTSDSFMTGVSETDAPLPEGDPLFSGTAGFESQEPAAVDTLADGLMTAETTETDFGSLEFGAEGDGIDQFSSGFETTEMGGFEAGAEMGSLGVDPMHSSMEFTGGGMDDLPDVSTEFAGDDFSAELASGAMVEVNSATDIMAPDAYVPENIEPAALPSAIPEPVAPVQTQAAAVPPPAPPPPTPIPA